MPATCGRMASPLSLGHSTACVNVTDVDADGCQLSIGRKRLEARESASSLQLKASPYQTPTARATAQADTTTHTAPTTTSGLHLLWCVREIIVARFVIRGSLDAMRTTCQSCQQVQHPVTPGIDSFIQARVPRARNDLKSVTYNSRPNCKQCYSWSHVLRAESATVAIERTRWTSLHQLVALTQDATSWTTQGNSYTHQFVHW
jgi:hypothetical protein